jgi:hypothetical protein
VVFIAGQWNGYVAEVVLGIMVIFEIIIIFALRQPEPEPIATLAGEVVKTVPKYSPEPVEETKENLEKTRYQ